MNIHASPASDIGARIRQTAQGLVAEGIWPTVNNVRERLGTGSNTTINNELRTWRQWFLSKIGSTARRPGWPVELGDTMDALWQMACAQAESHLDEVRHEATAQAEKLAVELQEQLTQLDACQIRLDEAAKNLEAQSADIAALQSALNKEITLKDNALSDLEVSQQAMMRLEAELLRLQQDGLVALEQAKLEADARVAAEKAEGERREAQAYERLEGLRLHLYEQMEQERKNAVLERQRQESQLATSRKEMAALQTSSQERLLESERARAAVEAEAARLQQEISALLSRLAACETEVAAVHSENHRLQTANAALDARLAAEQELITALRLQTGVTREAE